MQTQTTPPAHKVRSACDGCHKAKMKCSRGNPCVACAKSGSQCCYSVSNRLGRPPKGAAKRKKVGAKTTNNERPAATVPLLIGDHSQPEELLTLDDMFLNAYSDSSSSSESSSRHGFANLEDMANTFLPITDDHQQLQLDPLRLSHSPYDTPPLAHHDDILLHNNNDHLISPITLDDDKHNFRLWQGQLGCRTCRYDEDDAALLLSVIRIGTTLKRLWRFFAYQQQQRPYERSPGTAAKVTLAEAAIEAATGLTPKEQLRYDTTDPLINSLMNINVEDYQVPEDEQMFLIGMMVMGTLRRVKKTLEELRGRIRRERQTDKNEDHSGHPLSGLIPSMLDNLDESARKLEQSFQGSVIR